MKELSRLRKSFLLRIADGDCSPASWHDHVASREARWLPAMRRLANAPVDEQQAMGLVRDLQLCWDVLGSDAPMRSLKEHSGRAGLTSWGQVVTPSKDVDPLDAARIVDNLRVSFASAASTHWARRHAAAVADAAIHEELLVWLSRAAGMPEAPRGLHTPDEPRRSQDKLTTTGWVTDATVERRLGEAAESLAAGDPGRRRGLSRALYWARRWLSDSPDWAGRSRVEVPFLTYRREGEGSGDVHRIAFARLEGAGGGLIESPGLWNQPIGVRFLEVLREASEATWPGPDRPAIGWSLTLTVRDADGLVAGPSHGLAVRVGCRLLRDGRLPDDDVVFSAQVGPGPAGPLGGVGGLKDKWEAARAQGFRRLGICSTDQTQFPNRPIRTPFELGDGIYGLDSVDEAVALATKDDEATRTYLRAVAYLPDGREPPAYRRERTPGVLYVVPDVLEQPLAEAVQDHASRRKKAAGMPRPGPASQQLATDERDVGEHLPFDDEEPPSRRGWGEIVDELARTPGSRGVLLGPPGQGKSFVAEMTASRLAAESLESLRGTDASPPARVDEVAFPILVPLARAAPEVARRGEALAAEALAEVAVDRLPNIPERDRPALRRLLVDHLRSQQAWLFLDGLDEVAAGQEGLRAVLRLAREIPGRVLVGSRPYGLDERQVDLRADLFGVEGAGVIPEAARSYRLAPFTPGPGGQVEEFAALWFGPAGAPERLMALLRRSNPIQSLARNPYLLELLCAVAEARSGEIGEDLTRTLLYELFLETILGEHLAPYWGEFLDAMAARMIGRHKDAIRSPMIYGEAELARWLGDPAMDAPCEERRPDGRVPIGEVKRMAAILLDHDPLLRKRRLLVRASGDLLAFPHRSMAEFLAGRFLAGQVEAIREGRIGALPGWLSGWLGGKDAMKALERLAWRPDFRDVVRFTVGSLTDPTMLLERLADANTDDDFRHRLGLASASLSETQDEFRRDRADLIDRIHRDILDCWKWYVANDYFGNTSVIEHLRIAIPISSKPDMRIFNGWIVPAGLIEQLGETPRLVALLGLDGFYELPALEPLVALLGHLASDVREAAARELGKIGQNAVPATGSLAGLLGDVDYDVRKHAIRALERVGPAAIASVTVLLGDTNPVARANASHVLRGMGPAAAPAAVPLVALLDDADHNVRREAADALRRIGQAAVGPLAVALGVADPDVRERAAETLRDIGPAAEPAVWPLADLLRDDEPEVRLAAAEALRKIGTGAAPAIGALTSVLGDTNTAVRKAAAYALGWIGPPAASAVGPLVGLLSDSGPEVRVAAAYALGKIESGVGPLTSLLDDADPVARWGVAFALGGFDVSAVKPLSVLLRDADHEVRAAAADALSGFGFPAVRPLMEALGDPDPDVRSRAVFSLGWIGPAAEAAVGPLITLLCDAEHHVRVAAMKTLPRIGPVAIGPLSEALKDGDPKVRSSAASALEGFGMDAAPEVESLSVLLRDSDHSVRWWAAFVLSAIGPDAAPAVGPLATLLCKDDDHNIKQAAMEALGRVGPPAVGPLTALLVDDDNLVRKLAAEGLGKIGPNAASTVGSLVRLLNDAESDVQIAAADALGEIGTAAAEAVCSLTALLSDPNHRIKAAAARALGGIGRVAVAEVISSFSQSSEDPCDVDVVAFLLRKFMDEGWRFFSLGGEWAAFPVDYLSDLDRPERHP